MKNLKNLGLGFIFVGTLSGHILAKESVEHSNKSTSAEWIDTIDRDTAIMMATRFSECSGFFQGTSNSAIALKGEDGDGFSAIMKRHSKDINEAAMIIWSKHGTDFSQISKIKKTSTEKWTSNFLMSSKPENSNSIEASDYRAMLKNCTQISNAASAVKSYEESARFSTWK